MIRMVSNVHVVSQRLYDVCLNILLIKLYRNKPRHYFINNISSVICFVLCKPSSAWIHNCGMNYMLQCHKVFRRDLILHHNGILWKVIYIKFSIKNHTRARTHVRTHVRAHAHTHTQIPCSYSAPPFPPTSCTPSTCNIYLHNSLATVAQSHNKKLIKKMWVTFVTFLLNMTHFVTFM
jgi:hypothetical protein